MSQQQDEENKKYWNDTNTRLFMHELKKYHELWKNGSINKKKILWQKVADALKKTGFDCTAEQVENRYKTLLRSYRKSRGYYPRYQNRKSRPFLYENEFSFLFDNDTAFSENFTTDRASPECIVVDQDSTNDDEDFMNQFNPLDEESLPEQPVRAKTYYSGTIQSSRTKLRAPKKTPGKTSVEVLTEIKELMKKVELRRQLRHEQNLQIAKEKNELLKKKNELMEKILQNQF